MTHPGHNITHCVHGTIVSQCRCAIKDKPSVVVECPKNCDARRVHLAGSDEVVERVENQLYAMRNDGWDLRPFIALAAEVRALRKDGERLDWLANQSEPSWSLFFSSSWQTSPELRTAIDAAMAREGKA